MCNEATAAGVMQSQVVVVAVSFTLIALGAGFLLWHFALKSSPADVLISVWVSWVLGFVGVLLLPYDISVSLAPGSAYNNREEDSLLGVWSSIYWITFSLAWILLPVQMEYHASGEFSILSKLIDAVYKNFMFGLLVCCTLIIYLIYELITTEKATVQVYVFLMAVGNTYGVLLLVVLAGSGLIGVPRRLWEMTEFDSELERCWLIAPQTEEAFQDSRFSLEDAENEAVELCWIVEESTVSSRIDFLVGSKISKEQILQYCSILREGVAAFESEGKVKRRPRKSAKPVLDIDALSSSSSSEADAGLVVKAKLVEVHAALKKAQVRFQASHRRWRSLLEQAVSLETMLDEHEEMGISSSDLTAGGGTLYAGVLRYFRRDKIKQFLLRGASLSCLALSVIILSCELLMSVPDVKSPLGLLIDDMSDEDGKYESSRGSAGAGSNSSVEPDSLGVQFICFFALAYLAACTFYSLFCMNIGYDYSLSGPQQSTPSSLLFNGCYSARLQFSLGYNFILMLNTDRLDATAFSSLMTNMETIPVAGTSLNVYVPLVILIVFIIALFRQYQRLVSMVPGFEVEGMLDRSCCYCLSSGVTHQQRSPEELDTIETGKRLVQTEKRRLGAAAAAGTAGLVSTSGAGVGVAGGGTGGTGTRNPLVQVRAPSVMETLKMRAVEMTGKGNGEVSRPATRGYDHLDIHLDDEGDSRHSVSNSKSNSDGNGSSKESGKGTTGGGFCIDDDEEESVFSGGRYAGG